MKQTAINYGKVLFELGISEDAVETAKQLYLQSEELRKVLNSPIVTRAQKHRIIDKLFPQEMHSFLKKVVITTKQRFFLTYSRHMRCGAEKVRVFWSEHFII